ncbi:MAG: SRPBCC family protein [Halorhabdus sp.]
MASVERSRVLGAEPGVVEDLLTGDVEALVTAAGYDSVTVEGDRIDIEQRLGLATLSLTLRRRSDAEATLAIEQEEGHFETMWTEYDVEPTDGGTELTARTEFTLGGVAGSVLDETLVRRQRTKELEAQLDDVEQRVAAMTTAE